LQYHIDLHVIFMIFILKLHQGRNSNTLEWTRSNRNYL